MSGPPDLNEVQERARIEREVRNEYAARDEQERAADRDRALLALYVVTVLVLTVTLPLLALVVGLSWRTFRWAAGWGW